MDENAEIDIEALSDEVYIPLNLLPAIVRNLNSRLAAIEHEHSAVDITSGTLPAARIAEGSLPGSKIEEGTVTLDRFEKSVRDSLSQIPFATKAMAEDLDDHELGAVAFKDDTANIPSGFSYGICICLRATSSWLWQFAMSTEKSAIFTRRKINAGAWTSWVQL